MIWRNNLSWKTYLYKQNRFYVWKNSFRGELVLLLVETNVNLVFLYDNEFNKLTFDTFEKHGMDVPQAELLFVACGNSD